VEVAACQAQVDGDDAVLGLAQPAAPLLLDTGRLVPLPGITGLVDQADGVWALGLGGHRALDPIPQYVLVPLELAAELLQGAWGDVRLEGDRFDTLLGQVGTVS